MRVFNGLLVALLVPCTLLFAQKKPFSSSDAADAAERLSGHRSHMDESIRMIAGTRMEGPAITMQLVQDGKASLMEEGLKAIKVFEEAPVGSVIVVCLDGATDFAVFGATFATLSRSRHLGGIVTSGAMRGASDLRRIGLPIFSHGTVPGSAGGHYRLASVNELVTCAGVAISPGDLVVGDSDGVAIIPRDVIPNARSVAQHLRDEKERMLPLIARYRSYTEAAKQVPRK